MSAVSDLLYPSQSAVEVLASDIQRQHMASCLSRPSCTGCCEQHDPSAECEAPSTRMDSPELMR